MINSLDLIEKLANTANHNFDSNLLNLLNQLVCDNYTSADSIKVVDLDRGIDLNKSIVK